MICRQCYFNSIWHALRYDEKGNILGFLDGRQCALKRPDFSVHNWDFKNEFPCPDMKPRSNNDRQKTVD